MTTESNVGSRFEWTVQTAVQALYDRGAHLVLATHSQGEEKIVKAPASIHFKMNDGWIGRNSDGFWRITPQAAIRWMNRGEMNSEKQEDTVVWPSLGVIPGSIERDGVTYLVLDVDRGGDDVIDAVYDYLGEGYTFLPSVNAINYERGHIWIAVDPNGNWDNMDGDWKIFEDDEPKNGEIIFRMKWADTDMVELMYALGDVELSTLVGADTIRTLRVVEKSKRRTRRVQPELSQNQGETVQQARSRQLSGMQGYSSEKFDDEPKGGTTFTDIRAWIDTFEWSEGYRNPSLSQACWHLFTNPSAYPSGTSELEDRLDALRARASSAGLGDKEIEDTIRAAQRNAASKGVQGQSDEYLSNKTKRKTTAERKAEVIEADELAELPVYLRKYPEEDSDLARILHYRGEMFLTDGQSMLWVSLPNGSWERLDNRMSTVQRERIVRWIKESRDEAVEELRFHNGNDEADALDKSYDDSNFYLTGITNNVWRVVSETTPERRYGVKLVNPTDFNNRILHPVIPFQPDAEHEYTDDYSGLDLRTLEVINAAQMREMRILASDGWYVSPLMWNEGQDIEESDNTEQIRSLLEDVYANDEADISMILAQALLYPMPKIIIIKGGTSEIGKSTLFDCFSAILGESLVHFSPNCQTLFRGRGQYTFFENTVCTSMLAVYDECDKTENRPIPDDILRTATARSHEVIMKGTNPVRKNRMGMMVLLGNDFPLMDVSKVGAKRRLWVMELDWDEPMTEQERNRCFQPDALAWLFQRLVRTAHEIYLGRQQAKDVDEQYVIPQDSEAFNAMMEWLEVSDLENLSDHFELDRGIRVDSDISAEGPGIWAQDILRIMDWEDWDYKKLHQEMKKSMKGVIFRRLTHNKANEYRYGIKPKAGVTTPKKEDDNGEEDEE